MDNEKLRDDDESYNASPPPEEDEDEVLRRALKESLESCGDTVQHSVVEREMIERAKEKSLVDVDLKDDDEEFEKAIAESLKEAENELLKETESLSVREVDEDELLKEAIQASLTTLEDDQRVIMKNVQEDSVLDLVCAPIPDDSAASSSSHGHEDEDVPKCSLRITLPSGERVQTEFLVTDRIRRVYEFVANHVREDDFVLCQSFPRKELIHSDKTLEEVGLVKSAALISVAKERHLESISKLLLEKKHLKKLKKNCKSCRVMLRCDSMEDVSVRIRCEDGEVYDVSVKPRIPVYELTEKVSNLVGLGALHQCFGLRTDSSFSYFLDPFLPLHPKCTTLIFSLRLPVPDAVHPSKTSWKHLTVARERCIRGEGSTSKTCTLTQFCQLIALDLLLEGVELWELTQKLATFLKPFEFSEVVQHRKETIEHLVRSYYEKCENEVSSIERLEERYFSLLRASYDDLEDNPLGDMSNFSLFTCREFPHLRERVLAISSNELLVIEPLKSEVDHAIPIENIIRWTYLPDQDCALLVEFNDCIEECPTSDANNDVNVSQSDRIEWLFLQTFYGNPICALLRDYGAIKEGSSFFGNDNVTFEVVRLVMETQWNLCRKYEATIPDDDEEDTAGGPSEMPMLGEKDLFLVHSMLPSVKEIDKETYAALRRQCLSLLKGTDDEVVEEYDGQSEIQLVIPAEENTEAPEETESESQLVIPDDDVGKLKEESSKVEESTTLKENVVKENANVDDHEHKNANETEQEVEKDVDKESIIQETKIETSNDAKESEAHRPPPVERARTYSHIQVEKKTELDDPRKIQSAKKPQSRRSEVESKRISVPVFRRLATLSHIPREVSKQPFFRMPSEADPRLLDILQKRRSLIDRGADVHVGTEVERKTREAQEQRNMSRRLERQPTELEIRLKRMRDRIEKG